MNWQVARMVLVVVTSTGCWSATAPPSAIVTPAPAAMAPCVVDANDLVTSQDVKLLYDEKSFAAMAGPFPHLSVSFEHELARVKLETDEVELFGELDRPSLPIRPTKIEPYEGWLSIDAAIARSQTAKGVRLEVTLPPGFAPPKVDADIACSNLTFAAPPERAEDPEDAEWVSFEAGTRTEVRAQPTGPVVATIAPWNKEEPVGARVLAKQPGLLRVQIAGDTSVVIGWVAKDHASEQFAGLGQSGFGVGPSGMPATISCDRAVPIYVEANGTVARVGRYKPDATILPTSDLDAPHISVNLGTADLVPFIKRADVARCL